MRAKTKGPQEKLPRWRRVGRKILTVALGVSVIGLVFGGYLYHSATAQLDSTLTELGTHMMVYEDATHQDLPRQLLVNGQTLHLSSGNTPRSLTDVLDHFEGRCAAADGELTLQMERLVSDHPDVESDVPPTPTLRRDDGQTGYVTCIAMGPRSIDVPELALRIKRFGDTGDVSEIGDVRYVFAEQGEVRGEMRTHFVAMWSDGELNVDRMFPESGDAPGRDLDGVSRPPHARRMLQGSEDGMPQSMTVYMSRDGVSALDAFYRDDLTSNGWTLTPLDQDQWPSAAPTTLMAERGDRMVTVMLQPGEAGEGATAAIFDAP